MKLIPPFNSLSLEKHYTIQLFNATQEKPNSSVIHENIMDLWKSSFIKADFGYIGYMKIKNLTFHLCVNLTDKNLPVYTIDPNWSEQHTCLIHPQLKGFYGFLRLLKENQKDLQSRLPSLLKSLPKSVEFPEFWNYLIH